MDIVAGKQYGDGRSETTQASTDYELSLPEASLCFF